MSENKLNNWLSKFTGGKEAPQKFTQSKVTRSSSQPAPQKADTKKPATKTARPVRKNTGKSSPFTNHDPHKDRKTHAKRDLHHATNQLGKGAKGDIRVVPLGGMAEVGENMMFIEWGDDIIVIDTGLVFPGSPNYGANARIPDIAYLEKNKHKIKGVIYTHGHLDHIGGAPYILPKLGFPKVYATRLTRDMMLAQCEEHKGVKDKIHVQDITPKSRLKLGKFEVEFFHVNHSIPDGVGIAVRTPYGFIVNTSDFKIDHNPADEQPADLERIAHIGHQGVILGMVDSTNALRDGHAISETIIKDTLNDIIEGAEGRVIVATFSSNVGRVAKLVESAEKLGRTVFLTGRSMERNIAIARKNNFLKCKDKTLQRISPKAESMDPKKVLILSTGSQGEELAALTRMAAGEHAKITLRQNDTIVFSSSPIPGNEGSVGKVLDNLAELGINHIDHKQMEVHVSGHGHAEELKLMTALLNPKYFAPIHGELHMRYAHKKLAVRDLGYQDNNCFIMKDGQGVVLSAKGAHLMLPKESVCRPNGGSYIQERRVIAPEAIDVRAQLSESGLLLVKLTHQKGTLKTVEYKPLGFPISDTKHDFYQQLNKEIKAFWAKQYDPARPEKVLLKPLSKQLQKFSGDYLNLMKVPMVEVGF